ncbi:AAA family ATPase [Gordonia sp. CPCC 205333]|uniref:AAA family ATPase n=1 Tax=Gordonia sp. CPCC 205333 TaxID=3140790 RepID=UPI003AF3F48F
MNTSRDSGRFVMGMRVARDAPRDRYPFGLPAVARVARSGLAFPAGVTFLIGENGSGKSTLIEALAVAAGLNPEGGSQHNRFATRSTESELGTHVDLTWGALKPLYRRADVWRLWRCLPN